VARDGINEGREGLYNQSLDMQGDGEGAWVLLYLELMVFLVVFLELSPAI
jgi:hypothetical protein